MLGDPTLWLPGADHAGIAGQWVVERLIAKEGLTRHDLGREKFVERVWEYMDQYRGRIREQMRILGASCDWSRFTFTMDPGPSRAVRRTFKHLYDKGLIYRGERLISWCPALQHGPFGSRSRPPRRQGSPLASGLPGRRQRRASHRGHHPTRNDARRYRRWQCIRMMRATSI